MANNKTATIVAGIGALMGSKCYRFSFAKLLSGEVELKSAFAFLKGQVKSLPSGEIQSGGCVEYHIAN